MRLDFGMSTAKKSASRKAVARSFAENLFDEYLEDFWRKKSANLLDILGA